MHGALLVQGQRSNCAAKGHLLFVCSKRTKEANAHKEQHLPAGVQSQVLATFLVGCMQLAYVQGSLHAYVQGSLHTYEAACTHTYKAACIRIRQLARIRIRQLAHVQGSLHAHTTSQRAQRTMLTGSSRSPAAGHSLWSLFCNLSMLEQTQLLLLL